MTDDTAKYREIEDVIQEHFGLLVDKHSFRIVEAISYPDFGNWSAVLLSDRCRILIEQDRGEISVLIGPTGASRTWDHTSRKTRANGPWYSVELVLGYLELHLPAMEPREYPPSALDAQMSEKVDLLAGYMQMLYDLFAEPIFWSKKESLDKYCLDIIERQWEHLLHKSERN